MKWYLDESFCVKWLHFCGFLQDLKCLEVPTEILYDCIFDIQHFLLRLMLLSYPVASRQRNLCKILFHICNSGVRGYLEVGGQLARPEWSQLEAWRANTEVGFNVILLDFYGEYQNYTFLATFWYKQPEKQCFHLSWCLYGAILNFTNWLPYKTVLVNISAPEYIEIWFKRLNHHFWGQRIQWYDNN